MSTTSTSRHARTVVLPFVAIVLLIGCSKKAESPANTEQAKQQAATASPVSSPDEPPAPSSDVRLGKVFARRTGDLDQMAKDRNIRALVILNPIGFFYDKGQPRGVNYEALEEFQKFANQKLKTGKLDVKVTFLPMRVDQIEAALTEGVGDIIASGIVVTPEREKRVAFSTPVQTDVTQIIVTGSKFGQVSTLADLGGKEVYANPLTTTKVGEITWDYLATFDVRQADSAIDYIKKHAKDGKPFFMDVNFMKMHNPNNPAPKFAGKSHLGRYSDSVLELDDNIGRVMDEIRAEAPNTIVIITADNGAWQDAWPDAGTVPFRGEKGTPFEGAAKYTSMTCSAEASSSSPLSFRSLLLEKFVESTATRNSKKYFSAREQKAKRTQLNTEPDLRGVTPAALRQEGDPIERSEIS